MSYQKNLETMSLMKISYFENVIQKNCGAYYTLKIFEKLMKKMDFPLSLNVTTFWLMFLNKIEQKRVCGQTVLGFDAVLAQDVNMM